MDDMNFVIQSHLIYRLCPNKFLELYLMSNICLLLYIYSNKFRRQMFVRTDLPSFCILKTYLQQSSENPFFEEHFL